MSCDGLVAVLEAVQGLCGDPYGVTAVTHESTGRQLHIYFDRVVFAVLTRGTARTRHDTLISSDTAASDWPWGSKARPGRTRLGRLLL